MAPSSRTLTVFPRWTVAVCVLGLALMQLAWVFAVPPFRGHDEFDHAFRAAAVARGQWVASPEEATAGTGAVMHVPRDLVDSATVQCRDVGYVKDVTGRHVLAEPDDCQATGELANGMVTVGSAAGRYNPVFYALVGTPAVPFEGTAALYVMRFATVLLCSAFLAMAVWAVTLWARTMVPLVALLVTTTPLTVFSSSFVAPNGLEIIAAMGLWSGLFGLAVSAERGLTRGTVHRLWWVVAVSGSALSMLRSLGPVWLIIITATVLLIVPQPMQRCRALLDRRGLVMASCLGVTAAAGLGWTVAMRSLNLREPAGIEQLSVFDRLADGINLLPLWVVQAIGMFRVQPLTQGVILVTVATAFLCLLVLGLLAASWRVRFAMTLVVVLSCAIPIAATVLTANEFGIAWQGRYGLPYAVGLVLMAGLSIDVRARAKSQARPILLMCSLLWAVGQTVAPFDLARVGTVINPQAGSSAWWSIAPVALAALLLLGTSLTLLPFFIGGRSVIAVARDVSGNPESPQPRDEVPGIRVERDRRAPKQLSVEAAKLFTQS